VDAYLDIETTGLSPFGSKITVIGIGLDAGEALDFTQLYDSELTSERLLASLEGASRLFTYNGARFDLPFINSCLGVNLAERVEHQDLMFDCWRNGLYGGLKGVEKQLGIPRRLAGMSGWDAVLLWQRYEREGDLEALETLLQYNREDVANLKTLRAMLAAPKAR
jgi:uncharacterized protein YprB with RNaseH-like and TPR domain